MATKKLIGSNAQFADISMQLSTLSEAVSSLTQNVNTQNAEITQLQKIVVTQTEELEQQRVMIREMKKVPIKLENPLDWNRWFDNKPQSPADPAKKLTGSALSGNHYYRVNVPYPMSPELSPYRAECADIIEALQMTFNEGEAFKALWRGASTRLGNGKEGVTDVYNAEKAAHYGKRVEVQLKQQSQQDDAS